MDIHPWSVTQRQSRTPLDGRGRAAPAQATRLISRLPDREIARLMPLLQRVDLAPRQVLHYRNLPLEHVYFIETGLISVMARVSDRDWVEAWLVGSEGTTAVPVMLGDTQPPLRRVVQIGGTALRMPVAVFRAFLERSESFRQLMLRYTQLVLLQSSQCGVCNAQHSMRQRLARWLLLARDGLQAARIAVPHQTVARLMGVRRATISECLKDIEARGAIRTGRRLIEVSDRDVLERCACDCYRITRRERQRLLGL